MSTAVVTVMGIGVVIVRHSIILLTAPVNALKETKAGDVVVFLTCTLISLESDSNYGFAHDLL